MWNSNYSAAWVQKALRGRLCKRWGKATHILDLYTQLHSPAAFTIKVIQTEVVMLHDFNKFSGLGYKTDVVI